MTSLMLSHSDYTVAWICALPLEMAASKAMLDEIHENLSQPESDRNNYTLGRINRHNVVIACLPLGIYGVTAANIVLVQMLSTFPSLRFGLMVGIGGGVPTKTDIRLGDFVVSSPTRNQSGVIQYDFGKRTHDGFERTGCLDKPAWVLLTAISRLQCDQMLGQQNIQRIVMTVLEKNKEMKSQFSRPTDDWLFHTSYQHQNIPGGDCSTCDKNQLWHRQLRETDEPYVHYGLIASGNSLIKNGETRDQIAQELDVLCFEMEAAGLMDQLPFLVIRGISDYSDSHKQKNWQGYAALTAAAYTKQLLSVVSVSLTGYQVQTGHSRELGPEEEACLQSLCVTHPDEEKNKLKRNKGERAPGTCEWIMDTEEFKTWLASPGAILWLYGNPGVGKTIMVITLIALLPVRCDFDSRQDIFAYFFFDSTSAEHRTATAVLRGLLYQIIDKRPQFVKHISDKFKNREENIFNSFDALWIILFDIGRQTIGGEIYCVIDALDECDQESQRLLLS